MIPRESFNHLLADEGGSKSSMLDRSQSERGTPIPASSIGGWGCSWQCSMRMIDLEGQVHKVREAHAELQRKSLSMRAGEEAMQDGLRQREGRTEDLKVQLEAMRKLHEDSCLLHRAHLQEKEEEVIGKNDEETRSLGSHLFSGDRSATLE